MHANGQPIATMAAASVFCRRVESAFRATSLLPGINPHDQHDGLAAAAFAAACSAFDLSSGYVGGGILAVRAMNNIRSLLMSAGDGDVVDASPQRREEAQLLACRMAETAADGGVVNGSVEVPDLDRLH